LVISAMPVTLTWARGKPSLDLSFPPDPRIRAKQEAAREAFPFLPAF
jgi:hypothetical protein